MEKLIQFPRKEDIPREVNCYIFENISAKRNSPYFLLAKLISFDSVCFLQLKADKHQHDI